MLRCLYISQHAPERTQTDPYTGLPCYLSKHTSFTGVWSKPLRSPVSFRQNCKHLIETGPGILAWWRKLQAVLSLTTCPDRPDVVVCGVDEHSLTLGIIAGSISGAPVFCVVEDPPFTGRYEQVKGLAGRLEKRIRTYFLGKLLERCRGIFCFIEKEILKDFKLASSQVHQMMNGASEMALGWARKRPAAPEQNDECIVGLVGALTPAQGLDTLLEMFAAAKKRIPHLILRLIGPMEPNYRPVCEATLSRLGLNSSVEMTGWLPYEKMLERLNECDIGIYCNPSSAWFRAAQPLKICEYLSLAKPTIAWDYPGTRRLLGNGSYGLLVPEENRSAFADALLCLADQAERRKFETQISLALQGSLAAIYWYEEVLKLVASAVGG